MTYPKLRFLDAQLPPEAFSVSLTARKMKISEAAAASIVEELRRQRVLRSECGTYQVNVTDVPATLAWPAMLHLSIKRRDRQPIHDWRVLQAIKNAVVSPEHEGIELYPAESRLVDSANQFHLFVLAEAGLRFPFGFQERLVSGESMGGAVQRPLEDHA
jgi:hypothetical protein